MLFITAGVIRVQTDQWTFWSIKCLVTLSMSYAWLSDDIQITFGPNDVCDRWSISKVIMNWEGCL